MKLSYLGLLCLPFVCLAAQEMAVVESDPATQAQPAPAQPAQEERTVMHNGQLFVLAGSSSAKNVQTEEYVLRGEKLADWSQLLTMQRLSLEKASTPDEFTAFFKKKINQEGGARLEIIQQGKVASVFAVHFAKGEQNEEQIMVCLVLADKATGALNLVQYALKPNRMAGDVVSAQLKSWKSKFTQQALAAK